MGKTTLTVRPKSRLGIGNRLPKIQTEAEFSIMILMFEHFVGFPLFSGTRNYARGGKGPFRTSYWR